MDNRSERARAVMYEAAALFMDGKSTDAISEIISRKYGRTLSRVNVFPLIRDAVKHKVLRMVPPVVGSLEQALGARFGLAPGQVTVANLHPGAAEAADDAAGRATLGGVPALGAQVVARLVEGLVGERQNQPGAAVHLGLGPGHSSLMVSEHLGALLGPAARYGRVELHALTAGCPTRSARESPMAYFSQFDAQVVQHAHGLFTEPVIRCRDYEELKENSIGFREALAVKDKVDIIVTSMGTVDDPHCWYRRFLEARGGNTDQLKEADWAGDLQYRPFTSKGEPIIEPPDVWRLATLFEIDELRELAQRKGKYVVLVSRPCPLCGHSRAHGLRALLRAEPRVFTHLVTDAGTAFDLLHN
jgi:DNA-binding transcriptional regulator LsrR (DeoR family)